VVLFLNTFNTAIVTAEFLDFSAKNGNDLRKQVGLKGGESWCLCASRWKEAFDAKSGQNDPKVPKYASFVLDPTDWYTFGSNPRNSRVVLAATDKRALDVVSLNDLKMFAMTNLATPPEKNVNPSKDMPGAAVKESQEIGGKDPKA